MGSKIKLGLLGYPVAHSKSPLIHSMLADFKGLDLSYELLLTKPEDLKARVKELFEEGYHGFNVTVPHKLAVIDSLVNVSKVAQSVGAVNTCIRSKNGFAGFNTDIMGFSKALDKNGIEVGGHDVVVYGAGGAARSVVFSLLLKKPASLSIINRSRENALKLIDDIKGGIDTSVVSCKTEEEILSENKRFVAVQTTSAELTTGESIVKNEAMFELFDAAYDIVAVKEPTPFIKGANAHGIKVANGFDMLYYQAQEAFELWTGTKITDAEAEKVRKELRQ